MKLFHAFVTLCLLAMIFGAFFVGELSGIAREKNRVARKFNGKMVYCWANDGKGTTKSEFITITPAGEITRDSCAPGELP